MRNVRHFEIVGLLAIVVICAISGPGMISMAWGQAFGIIAGTVEKPDSPKGLAVRSQPSGSAPALGYLPVGTEIRACNDFQDQWARLQNPFPNGWVNMANLKPKGGQAIVAAVDAPDQCLIIRKGPDGSYEKAGCAALGERLHLSGVWSINNFARLESGGWVDATKISTDMLACDTPPMAAAEPEPPPPMPQPSAEYVPPSDGAGYTYAPSYNYGTFGVPSFLGPYGAFGVYPGWYPGVSVAVGSGYGGHYGYWPYRHWRHDWANHNRWANQNRWVNQNRSAALANRAGMTSNRSLVNRNNAALNNWARGTSRNFSNFRSGNALSSRGFSNMSRRGAGLSSGLRSGGSRAMAFRGGGGGGAFRGGGGRGGGHRR
jgi:hypothetical protein